MATTEMIICAVCGKKVPIERSRLFWTKEPNGPGSGTFRTCMKGTTPHTKGKT